MKVSMWPWRGLPGRAADCWRRRRHTPTNLGLDRVLIRTQPLGENYGGVLQAYALQKAIKALHREVDTDHSRPPGMVARLLRPLIAAERATGFGPYLRRDALFCSQANLRDFVGRQMDTTAHFVHSRRPPQAVLSRYSSFVVGSDQVWRPAYSDVPSSLFDFLPEAIQGNRLSYAASFGTDSLSEFTPSLVQATLPLAGRLDAVSVREASGVSMAAQVWGRNDAVQHVDPTLLLGREDYNGVIASAPSMEGLPRPGGIVVYILDPTPDILEAVDAISVGLGLPWVSIQRPKPESARAYRASPGKYRRIPVEVWLKAIGDAGLVITDSYHGCVFSIVFETDFLVFPNAQRGLTRFTSLLELTGLQGRALAPSAVLQQIWGREFIAPIDWGPVSARVDAARQLGLAYLCRHLSHERFESPPSVGADAASGCAEEHGHAAVPRGEGFGAPCRPLARD